MVKKAQALYFGWNQQRKTVIFVINPQGQWIKGALCGFREEILIKRKIYFILFVFLEQLMAEWIGFKLTDLNSLFIQSWKKYIISFTL